MKVLFFTENTHYGDLENFLISLINQWPNASDAFRLGKKNEKNGQLRWHTFKSAKTKDGVDAERDEKAVEVDIPIHPKLRKAIDAAPSDNLVYVATSHGRPF